MEHVDGFVERDKKGNYVGQITIDGVSLGDIECQMFDEKGKKYIWLKRSPILEYDDKAMMFKRRERRPIWECYLEKQYEDRNVIFRGEFAFLRFKYSIVALWDKQIGLDNQRLNLYIERLPMSKQSIINKINERKRNEQDGRGNTE